MRCLLGQPANACLADQSSVPEDGLGPPRSCYVFSSRYPSGWQRRIDTKGATRREVSGFPDKRAESYNSAKKGCKNIIFSAGSPDYQRRG
jgi:hypothetical protein